MLTLFTDTDTDVTPSVAAHYGCRLISMPYSIDGVTFFPYEDGNDGFDFHAFYDSLRAGVLPTTSAISEQRYIEYFEPEFAAGRDIFYVHFSAAMTATFDAMEGAVDALKAKYPGRKFYSLDTKGITIISYAIFREVGDRLLAGEDPGSVLEWGRSEVDHFAQYFFADDLKFFRRSGRVGNLAATMGGLIGLRPIITMTSEGKMESVGTEKGRAKAMARLLRAVEELGDDLEHHRIIVGHTDAPELAASLVEQLRAKLGEGVEILSVCTNPTAGSHCGPNGVGVAFHAKHR